jgi:hypothetical protein
VDRPTATESAPITDYGRPFRHLCPEADYRDTLTDDEFWAHVYPQGDDGPDIESAEDFDLLSHFGRPCEVCGEVGPCGYDAEGRPMIHTEEEANPDA